MRPILAACLLLFVPSAGIATTYVVRPDGTGDFPTIQAAIDAVDHGDVIELTDGVFTGDGNRNLDYGGKAITVRSAGHDPATCVIDCEGGTGSPQRGFLFVSGESPAAMLEAVTVRHAYADSCGAVLCRGASPTLRECVFTLNTVAGNGGAVGCTGGASPELVDCRFETNHAGDHAGALYCRFDSNPSLSGCLLQGNSSSTHGGAVHSRGTAPSFTDCTLRENSTAHLGGAVQNIGGAPSFVDCRFIDNSAFHAGAIHSQYGTPALTDCEFIGNQAQDDGGAALFTLPSTPVLTRCRFELNTSGQYGGAIVSLHDALTMLVECEIVGNGTQWHGGALHLYDGGLVEVTGSLIAQNTVTLGHGGAVSAGAHSLVTMTGCTLDDNVAPDTGRSIWLSDQSHLEMQQCIVSHGPSGLIACSANSSVELTCCDVFGNGGSQWTGCLEGQGGTAGNISADPLFCDASGGDWSIEEASPCSPAHSGSCDLIGAFPVGCGATTVVPTTWGAIKASFH